MQPTSRRNSFNASATPGPQPSAAEATVERPTEPRVAGALQPPAPSSFSRFSNMPPMVFHVQRFLERPEVLVLSTASRGLNAVTARTPDPLLRDLFAAQRQVAAQPAHPDELLDEATAQDLLSITRELFARRGEPAAPPAFRQRPLAAALMAIGREKIERTQAIRTREAHASNRELRDRWIRAAASDAQAQLTAKPWEGDVIHEAARILCGLGRTREAEQVLRWRLLWRPDDASARRQLVDVLLQGRQYDAAIEAMGVRNQLCAEADRNAWVSQYEENGSTGLADSILWTNTKAPIAQALLLQGQTEGAFHQIDGGVAADPFTLAVIEHSRGHEAEAQAAFARIADPFDRALFHAWQGNAQRACECMIRELEGDEMSALRCMLDVLHSPFLDPIRQSPHWQNLLWRSNLAAEQLDRIPFDMSPVDPECTRQAAELEIRTNAEAAERGFANNRASGNALLLAIELSYLGRFESAERVLRWESARFPNESLTQRWLGEVLMLAGRTDEALVQADIVDEMGGSFNWDVRTRHLLLSGQAQAVYDQERNAEHPDPEMMAMAAHTLGLFDERDRLIGELDNSYTAAPIIHAWAGQADQAFEWLHRGVAARASYEILRHVVHSPFIEPIRSDPRWPVFLRSVNMAPDQLAEIPLRFELPPLP